MFTNTHQLLQLLLNYSTCTDILVLCSQAFAEHYYNTFDTNRAGLAPLYQEQSMLTFEGGKVRCSQSSPDYLPH